MTVKEQVLNKYLEIKQDIINNLGEVFNRKEYYTRKYRGNLNTDINVSIDFGPDGEQIIQIFVRHKDEWIRDVIKYKRNDKTSRSGMFFESKIVSTLDNGRNS